MATFDVVIVNWNSGNYLRRCLASLEHVSCPGLFRTIAVDNASTDGSFDGPHEYSFELIAIRNPTNVGFAAACNQGARAGSAEFLLFLNPDTVLYPGSLERVRDFLRGDKGGAVGVCGIQLVDETGEIARSCSRDPRPLDVVGRTLFLDRFLPRVVRPHFVNDWDHTDSRPVEQIIGAFYVIRRTIFEELGGFDERFFVYYEEVDLSLRVKRAGYQVYYFAEAAALHTGGGTTDRVRATRQFYVSRSRLQFVSKHFSLPQAVLAAGAILVEPLFRAVGFGVRGDLTSARESLQAGARLLVGVPRALSVAPLSKRDTR